VLHIRGILVTISSMRYGAFSIKMRLKQLQGRKAVVQLQVIFRSWLVSGDLETSSSACRALTGALWGSMHMLHVDRTERSTNCSRLEVPVSSRTPERELNSKMTA
jgi:hypothetical protein